MPFCSGDTASKLEVTCKDDDTGLVIDLTGSTVKLKWRDAADALQTNTMTITDAPGGIVEYRFLAGELIAPQMKFETEITDSLGNVLRPFELIRETVRAALV